MNILLVGEEIRRNEIKNCFPTGFSIKEADIAFELERSELAAFDIVFDLNGDEDTTLVDEYPFEAGSKTIMVVSAVKTPLAAMVDPLNYEGLIIGLNCLPTFIDRTVKEVSILDEKDESAMKALMQKLDWNYQLVQDRVGMVTPRIICMIINEACYTVMEGTADYKDIDKSMKLGTNYPMGPFEWSDKMGVKDVYETLDALYHDTKDERYKICPLLKRKFLRDEPFLS